MSSLATSSPVFASTLAYLIRWPVFRFSWLNDIFSLFEVAGYSATGQVTRDRRRKPFQFARGAMYAELHFGGGSDSRRTEAAGSDSEPAQHRFMPDRPCRASRFCVSSLDLP